MHNATSGHLHQRNEPALPARHATLVFILAVFLSGGCNSTRQLTSRPPLQAPTIDGQVDDWQGAVKPFEGKPFSMGVMNDGEHLYFALLTHDEQTINQILRSGLDVWFDAEGSKQKVFGLHFPLGLMERERPGEGFQGGRARPDFGNGQPDPSMIEARFEAATTELDILGAEEQRTRLPSDAVPGIEVKATFDAGMLVYELKVPLRTSDEHPYAVDIAPGMPLGLGIETPELDREAMRERMQGAGGMGGGAMGGRGGVGGGTMGGQGGGRGGMGGPGFQAADPIKVWVQITLAS